MKLGLFFLGIISLGFCFEIAEHFDKIWGKVDLFLLTDAQWNPSSYVYFTGESLAYIALALVIRQFSPYKHIALAFVIIESIDLIDFYMTKSGPWFEFHGWPVTYNLIKLTIFVLFLIYEFIHIQFAIRK
jgi:hypothetical protein